MLAHIRPQNEPQEPARRGSVPERTISLKRRREGQGTFLRASERAGSSMVSKGYALGGHLDSPSDLRCILGTMINDKDLRDLCDVVLVVDGERFPAHKAVLAASSRVFKAMFTRDMKERHADEIVLSSLDPRSWRMAVQFIYTAQVDIEDEDTALLILSSARMYQLETLERFVESFLISKLTIANCFELLGHADHYNLLDLRDACEHTMEDKFEEMALSPAFLDCPVSLLSKLVQSGGLVIKSESSVLDAVTRWVEADEEQRLGDLDKLLHMVRLTEMNESELAAAGRSSLAEKSITFQRAVLGTLIERREDSDGVGQLLASGFHLKARKRRERPFTFAHLLRGVNTSNIGDEEEIVRTPWSTDPTGRHIWRLKIYPRGYLKAKGDYLSMYVQGRSVFKGDDFDVQARFDIFLVNRKDGSGTLSFSSQHHFTAASDHWGFHRFCPLGRLTDLNEGFLSEDTDAIVVGANVLL